MPTAGSITNITDPITNSELSVFEVKSLRNLTHNSLGLWNSATPDNPKAVGEQGATAIFWKSKMLQLQNYAHAAAGSPGITPQQLTREFAEKIDADDRIQASKYEIESQTLPKLGFQTREQFIGYVVSSLDLVQTGFMDCIYLQAIINAANKDTANRVVNIPNLSDLNTKDKRINAYRQIVRKKVLIARDVNRYNLGSNPSDYNLLLHAVIWPDLKLEINAYSGSQGAEVRQDLITGFEQITNFSMVKDSVWFNKNIPAGTNSPLSKDISFDFRGVYGALVHKEAIFVAIQGLKLTARVNGNGNQEVMRKFTFYQGAVRPELLCIFKESGTFTPTPNEVKVISSTENPVFTKAVAASK